MFSVHIYIAYIHVGKEIVETYKQKSPKSVISTYCIMNRLFYYVAFKCIY